MIRILGVGNSLITGLQGAGKSHFIMSQIKLILDEQPELNIYLANVDGVTLQSPNLHIVSPDFSWVNDAPNNSLIIYDEAGTIERFNNSSTRINSSNDVQTLTMARHKGKTIVFMAQDSSIVHPSVRKLLTRHFHFSNPYNDKDKTHCFVFPQVQDRLDGQNKSWQNNAIEEFKHVLDPEIFPLYKSVDDGAKHNKKKQYNQKAQRAKLVAMISAGLILPTLAFGVYFAFSYVKDVWGEKPEVATATAVQPENVTEAPKIALEAVQEPAQGGDYVSNENRIYARTQTLYEQRLPPDYQIITTDANLKPSAVISDQNGNCRVYNTYGDVMIYSKKECQNFLSEAGRLPKARTSARFVSQHPTSGGGGEIQEVTASDVSMPET